MHQALMTLAWAPDTLRPGPVMSDVIQSPETVRCQTMSVTHQPLTPHASLLPTLEKE